MAQTLIRSGALITMDPRLGLMATGDILVNGDRIVEVAHRIDAPDAQTIDASGCIVIPGLVNAHVHLWQTVLRGIGSDWAGSDYYNYMHAGTAPRFTPDDLRVSEFAGALGQLLGGTTTVFDWCHNNPTPEHTDAAIEGLRNSGIRALFGHGTVKPKPRLGEPHFSQVPHPRSEIERLRRESFTSDDGLLRLAMCILGPDYSTLEVCRQDFALARELGLISSAHVWGRANRLVPGGYRQIAAEGLLDSRHNVVHANYIEDDEIKILIDAGATITATPPAEIRGHGKPPLIGRVAAAGGKPSIGNDSEVGITGSMLETIRLSLQVQRLFDNIAAQARLDNNDPTAVAYHAKNLKTIGTGGGLMEKISVTSFEALRWATVNNAEVVGLGDQIGSLTPGKKADIVILRRNAMNLAPALNPVDTVVMYAHPDNVDTVMVDGRIVKRNGKVTLPVDLEALATELDQRGRRLLAEAGFSELAI